MMLARPHKSFATVPRAMSVGRPSVFLQGMWGAGDNLHQRAILREMMKTKDVWLQTYYASLYHDLIAQGLRIVPFPKRPARIREGQASRAQWARGVGPRDTSVLLKLTYNPAEIHRHGSILAAQFASVGLTMPERPDFSLPVPLAWRTKARRLIEGWKTGGKPLLMYRPIVLNDVWACPSRSPDTVAYAKLFAAIREKFFCVSFANLGQGGERIVGEKETCDAEINRGEADFETLAGLFVESSLVFGNPGFTPVLAQAVGAPNIIVYGGNESFRTTNSVGAHLADTLAIEPVKPCACHDRTHDCDKTLDIGPALERVVAFADVHSVPRSHLVPEPAPRVLIFGTTYVDTAERLALTQQWLDLHGTRNPDCDLLLVDSASPVRQLVEDRHGRLVGVGGVLDGHNVVMNFSEAIGVPIRVHAFTDNIGHLSRGGRDGWGRAFCHGLKTALGEGYEYVAHIEGDSLLRLPVMPIIERMKRETIAVASVPVEGTKRKEIGWVETGLMFFNVKWLAETKFIERYDWANRKERPTPERVIFDLIGADLTMLPLRAERADKSQVTVDNVGDLDWVTHCHGRPEIYDRFVSDCGLMAETTVAIASEPSVRLNFGCGKNKLAGWANYDSEIDISKPLPFADGSADHIFAEHVVEHVPYKTAYVFFRECRRVLKPGGFVRIAVPSIEQVLSRADDAYVHFTRRWSPEPGKRGAVRSLIEAHGHECGWTAGLLATTLYAAGFDHVHPCCVGESMNADLRGVEGHHKIIGEKMNLIETVVCEAS